MTREDPELGTVKHCAKCGQWWPLDDEFFYFQWRSLKDGSRVRLVMAWCRACWGERSSRYHAKRRAA